MEMELKLLLDPAARAAVEGHAAFAEARRKAPSQETTTYFDTTDLRFRRQGASLRVRRRGDGFVQTVKLARNDDAFGLRSEWEWLVDSGDVDVAELAALPESLAGLRAAARLAIPIFTSEIRRDTWLIRLDGDTEVEAVIDEGVVRAGARSTPVCEVELELKGGAAVPMYGLALALVEHADLRYGVRSKADRGYGLLEETPEAAPPELPSAGLEPGTTLGQAFPRLIAAALRDLAAEILPAARGAVEGVHRLRAAIRKLRALLVFFAPHIDREAAARFNATLRELGGTLGRRRDWDVFLTETLPEASEELPAAALDPLILPAETHRRVAEVEVVRALEGPLPTRLILGLAAWTAAPGWCCEPAPDMPLGDVLPALLDRLGRRVRRRSRHVGRLDADELHDLRKAMKKLRYSAEEVASLYAVGAGGRYLKALKAPLTLLGRINDASVTRTCLDRIATPEHPELSGPAAALLGRVAARRAKARDKLERKLDAFRDLEGFWR